MFISAALGLQGIELGVQMIRQVVREIRNEFPEITRFSSLSPIPGFRDYLIAELQAFQKSDASGKINNFLTNEEHALLMQHLFSDKHQQQSAGNNNIWPILIRLLKTNSWIRDDELVKLLQKPLMRKCAHYLYNEKRRGFALNAVGE